MKFDHDGYLLKVFELERRENYVEIIKISEEMYKVTKSNVSLEIALDAIANIFAIENSPEDIVVDVLSTNPKFLKRVSNLENYTFGRHLELKNEIDEERVRDFTNNLKNYKKFKYLPEVLK